MADNGIVYGSLVVTGLGMPQARPTHCHQSGFTTCTYITRGSQLGTMLPCEVESGVI